MKKLSAHEIQKIQELFRQGYSVREIAKISGRSPNTVLRYKPRLPQQHTQQTPPQTAQMPHFKRRYTYGETQPGTHNYPPTEPFPPSRSPNTNYDSALSVPHRSETDDLLKEIREELKHHNQRDRYKEEQQEREKKEQERQKLEAQKQAKKEEKKRKIKELMTKDEEEHKKRMQDMVKESDENIARIQAEKATPPKSPQTDIKEPELTYLDAKNIIDKQVNAYYHNRVKAYERYSNNKIHHLRELDKLKDFAAYRNAIILGISCISEPLINYGIPKLIKGWLTPKNKNIYHKVHLKPAREDTDIKMGIPIAKVIEWKPSCSRTIHKKKRPKTKKT